jgi:hypothetical protein
MSVLQIALTSAAISLAVPAVLKGLLSGRSARGEARAGKVVLRYGPTFRRACVGLLVVPIVGIAALAVAFPPSTPTDVKAVLGMFALFTVLGVPLVVEALGVEITLDARGIARRSPWSRDVFVPWEQVRRVVWSESARWWVVEAEGGARVRLHEFLSGLDDFKALVIKHAPDAVTPFAAS